MPARLAAGGQRADYSALSGPISLGVPVGEELSLGADAAVLEDAVGVGDGLPESVPVGDGLPVSVGVDDGLPESVGVGDPVVGVADGLPVGVADGPVEAPEPDGLGVGCELGREHVGAAVGVLE
jgi:hypothetical protein